MKQIFLLIAVALLFAANLQAQDTNYARHVIRQLSSERMQGRGPSWRGDSLAAQFIRSELKMKRVKPLPGTEDFYQRFTYNTCSMEGQCWIEVGGRKLKSYEEFRVMPWSATVVKTEMKLVRVPLATFVDSERMQAFLRRHEGTLADAVVYIDCTDPKTQLTPLGQQKLHNLRKRNPFGSRAIMLGLSQLSTPTLSDCDRQRDYAYIEVLAKAMPKKCATVNLCVNTQYRPAYRSQNVCGIIEGESDSMMVITAHYDHLGTMGDGYKYMKDGEIHHEGNVLFPGAHDNASGVAAALDIARMYSSEKPRYTLVFLFLAGEEAGLKGSTYAAEHPLVDFSKVRLLINLDLFCGGDDGLMVFNAESPETKPYFQRLKNLNDALQVAPELRPRKNSPNSDHFPFSSLCPSIYILTMGHPYGGYHDPADRCEACGLGHYYNYLLLVSSLLM